MRGAFEALPRHARNCSGRRSGSAQLATCRQANKEREEAMFRERKGRATPRREQRPPAHPASKRTRPAYRRPRIAGSGCVQQCRGSSGARPFTEPGSGVGFGAPEANPLRSFFRAARAPLCSFLRAARAPASATSRAPARRARPHRAPAASTKRFQASESPSAGAPAAEGCQTTKRKKRQARQQGA